MTTQLNIGSFLHRRAALDPVRLAYVDGNSGVRLTFAELEQRVNRLANAFIAAGIEKGERVGLLVMNSPEFVESYFALATVGAVIVPLNWRLVPDELEFILKDSGTKRLIFGEEFLDSVSQLHARGDKTDLMHYLQVAGEQEIAYFAQGYEAFRDAAASDRPTYGAFDDEMVYIMYTSGTTGLPKGVVHTHTSCLWGNAHDICHGRLPRWRCLSHAIADVSCGRAHTNYAKCLCRCDQCGHAQFRSSTSLAATR